jgi:hypothetical protein
MRAEISPAVLELIFNNYCRMLLWWRIPPPTACICVHCPVFSCSVGFRQKDEKFNSENVQKIQNGGRDVTPPGRGCPPLKNQLVYFLPMTRITKTGQYATKNTAVRILQSLLLLLLLLVSSNCSSRISLLILCYVYLCLCSIFGIFASTTCIHCIHVSIDDCVGYELLFQ